MMALAMSLTAALPVPGRSVAASQHGVAASSQPLAAQAAVQVLARGGNAVDAAIAANAVTGVTEPMMNGIGGDLFAIVYVAREDKVYGLNASGWIRSRCQNRVEPRRPIAPVASGIPSASVHPPVASVCAD